MAQHKRNRNVIGIAVGLVGALGATGVAVAATSSEHDAARAAKHAAPTYPARHLRGHAAATQAAFPVLNRSATPADTLPAGISAGIPPREPAEVSQSRLVGTVPGGQAWLVPETDGGICMIVSGTNAAGYQTAAGSCTSATSASSAGIGVSGPAGAMLVLPAGSSAVRVTSAGASSASVAPNSNGLVTIPAPYQSASYTGPDGSAHSFGSVTAAASAAS
jgi:hypothetical protein